jgi:hypothetical protein
MVQSLAKYPPHPHPPPNEAKSTFKKNQKLSCNSTAVVIQDTTVGLGQHYSAVRTTPNYSNYPYMKTSIGAIGSTACLAAALAFTTSTTQAQNLLTDPGFESGAPGQPNPIPIPAGVGGGWAVFNGATYSTAHPETGLWSIQETEGAGVAWNFEAPYQVIGSVSAGQKYTLTADYMTTTGITEAPGGYVPAVIQLTFLNAAGGDIGTVETGGVGANAVQYTPAGLNTWYTGVVSATAPAGAAYVAPYLAFMENGSQTGADTLYWDNASLTLVPEPTSLALLGLGLASGLILRRRQ